MVRRRKIVHEDPWPHQTWIYHGNLKDAIDTAERAGVAVPLMNNSISSCLTWKFKFKFDKGCTGHVKKNIDTISSAKEFRVRFYMHQNKERHVWVDVLKLIYTSK